MNLFWHYTRPPLTNLTGCRLPTSSGATPEGLWVQTVGAGRTATWTGCPGGEIIPPAPHCISLGTPWYPAGWSSRTGRKPLMSAHAGVKIFLAWNIFTNGKQR